jgi:hypothetical protein
MTIAGNRVKHLRAVREEKRVSNIEENDAPLCHESILPKASVESTVIDRADALEVSRDDRRRK